MKITELIRVSETLSRLRLPLFTSRVRAGFPSAADDFIDRELDLNEFLVTRPSATFFAKAEGDSLSDICITNDDILIVDRSAERVQGSVVVAAIDGELTCKILDLKGQRLLSANNQFQPINVAGRADLVIEGVVLYSIKRHFR